MARIAIAKIRNVHDIDVTLNRASQIALRLVGANSVISRLKDFPGQPTVPQLTLPYLAGLVEQYTARTGQHHECVLIDEPEERIREVIAERGPFDMIWFTVNTPAAPATYRLCRELGQQGVITVLGGIHISVMAEEAARFADCVVTGEGETAVPELLADFDANGKLEPLYRGPRQPDLIGLPVPDWGKWGPTPLVFPIQTSRGCRNACAFCSTTRHQGIRRRHRPIEEIVAEIQGARDHGNLDAGIVFFTDNNIVSDTDHRHGKVDTSYARELFAALRPLNIEWAGQGEINLADDQELLELAVYSGCRVLLVGFETLDQDNLDGVNKPSNSVSRYAEQTKILHEWGIGLIGCFLFGMDQDTPAVFDRTADFIQRYVDIPQVSIITPFPGTALYKQMAKEGRLLHGDWSRYDVLNPVFAPTGMSARALCDGFSAMGRKIYAPHRLVARAARFASGVRYGPVAEEGWASRMARILAPNLYYRATSVRSTPRAEPTGIEVELGLADVTTDWQPGRQASA